MKSRPLETALASRVVDWLVLDGWETYTEVALGWGKAADIVATRGSVLWVIECKTVFSIDVLSQADSWRGFAHLRSVAVPKATRSYGHFVERITRSLGVGLLYVDSNVNASQHVCPSDYVVPVFDRPLPDYERQLRAALPRAKTAAVPAGTCHGQRGTPWRQTVQTLIETVRQHPGIDLKVALSSFAHHYSTLNSARSALGRLIHKGVIPELRLENGALHLNVGPTPTKAPPLC